MIAWSSAKRRSPWISTKPVNSRSMKPSRPGRFGCRATSTRCHGVSVRVELAAHRFERAGAACRSRDRARRCAGSSDERLDLLQQHGDRFFEVERLSHTVLTTVTRSDTDAVRRRSASTSAISARATGRTRICDAMTSARTRSAASARRSAIRSRTTRAGRRDAARRLAQRLEHPAVGRHR